MSEEIWAVIPGWEAYEASTLGRIRRIKTGLILSQNEDQDGYLRLNLSCDGRRKNFRVNILIMRTFKGEPPPGKTQVAHWDGDMKNNSFGNLRYATNKENTEDKRRHGRMPMGEKSHMARLSDANARLMLAERMSGAKTLKQLADDYQVSYATVQCVVYGTGRFSWLAKEPK